MKKIKEMYYSFKWDIKYKLKNLLCGLGIHEWRYFDMCENRICERCNRTEEFNTYTNKYSKVKQLDFEKRNEILY